MMVSPAPAKLTVCDMISAETPVNSIRWRPSLKLKGRTCSMSARFEL
jgi:hypothetical protein